MEQTHEGSFDDIPDYEYSSQALIYSSPTWESHRKSKKLSKFDKFLGQKWEMAMELGAFNYKLNPADKKQRIVPGKHKFVLSMSVNRLKLRRAPEFIDHVDQPFNPKKFNFNKVKPVEILMNFCPKKSRSAPSENIAKVHTYGTAIEAINSETKPKDHATGHIIAINISPFDYGHCLLVPDVEKCIHQRITLRGLELALEMILLSNHPGLRIAFNGLCALASVNHQHLHGWYMDEPIWVEKAPVRLVSGLCHEVVECSSRAFVFQLHGTTAENLARAVFQVTNYFQSNDIAHNLFMTRGLVFGEPPSSSLTTVRVLVWPRKHYLGAKNPGDVPLFHVAVAELAGHIPMYQEHRFDDLTEEEIVEVIRGSLLPDDKFNEIRHIVKSLMESIESHNVS